MADAQLHTLDTKTEELQKLKRIRPFNNAA